MLEQLINITHKIRKTKPLILNMTNYVTMDFMANCLLAIGAAPIMSEEMQELSELIAIANSINLNLGTLNDSFCSSAKILVKESKVQGKPIVLDPVGAGATKIRTATALELAPYADIIRGNASEIMALHINHSKTLGVESSHASQEALGSANELCNRLS